MHGPVAMADPATVIQVISASTSLVAQCAKVIKGLHDLAAKYKSAELSIRATAHELDTIRLAWERIENTLRSWEGNEGSDDELLQRLNQKLDFGALIVASLDEDMTTFTKRPFTFTQRSKYVWTESKFKDHQDRIRGQVLAMNLLVSVLKMSVTQSPICGQCFGFHKISLYGRSFPHIVGRFAGLRSPADTI